MIRQTMRDFVGLENADDTIKKAMTDFSYLSAVGNMDDAFKAIKSIKRLVPMVHTRCIIVSRSGSYTFRVFYRTH